MFRMEEWWDEIALVDDSIHSCRAILLGNPSLSLSLSFSLSLSLSLSLYSRVFYFCVCVCMLGSLFHR